MVRGTVGRSEFGIERERRGPRARVEAAVTLLANPLPAVIFFRNCTL